MAPQHLTLNPYKSACGISYTADVLHITYITQGNNV